MKKYVNKIFIIIIIYITIFITCNMELITTNILSITRTWYLNIFPPFFIMLFLSDIITNYIHFKSRIGLKIYLIIISILSGVTNGSKNITKTTKNYTYINIIFYPNILFLYKCSLILKLDFVIILLQLLLINSFMLIFIKEEKMTFNHIQRPLNELIITSIKKNTSILLMILGSMIVFSILGIIITNYLPFNLKVIIIGLLEITSGIELLKGINSIFIKKLLFLTFINFGGIAIYTQIKSIFEDSNIKIQKHFIYRLIAILLALISSIIIN